MRRKIQDIIRGEFEYNEPSLLLEGDSLSFSVIENEDFAGSFPVESNTDEPVRGIVTCEHPGIRILTPEFDATFAEIRFEFSGEFAAEGEVEEGVFVITSNSGEYLLPFHARITRHYISASIGKIRTLDDFVNLCNLNWEEGVEVFESSFFVNIFHENAEYYKLLYHALTAHRCTSHEMEEFLIAVRKKKRSEFFVRHSEKTYHLEARSVQDIVEVRKSEWGYCDIRVSCEEPFISLGKRHLHMYDFFGKHAEFPFQIHPSLMHRGKNYAVITLDDGFSTKKVVLTCLREERTEHSADREKRMSHFRMENSYLSYRIGEKSESEWISESVETIRAAAELEPNNRWLNLFLAYVYYRANDIGQMEKQMQSLPRNSRNARTPLGAMYLFLSFLKAGTPGRAETIARIREIRARYRTHPILTWILLLEDDTLARNPQRKYEMIRRHMSGGSLNPLFYLEAARILQKNPEILNSQDDFDIHLLGWMGKRNLLTRELALRIQGMAQGKRHFSKSYFRILSKCYKKYPDVALLKTICVSLIKSSQYGEIYFPWFKRGIEQHLKLAGLYEAYMLSWSRAMGELPEDVVRYFSMNSSLPTRRKAMLFAYIARNKSRLENDWPSYMDMVKNFAAEELAKAHMNDDLAVIYEEIRHAISDNEWEQIKQDSENCYKIYVEGNSFFAVRVLQNLPRTVMRRATISDDFAYIYLYRKPYVILYEGRDGRLYATGDACRVSKVLPGGDLSSEKISEPASGDMDVPVRMETDSRERLENMAGSIDEMTDLLLNSQREGIPVVSCAQQLMVRMLFTGHLGERHEEVFRILRGDEESEELILAYVSTLCRNYMLHDYPLQKSVYLFLGEWLLKKKRANAYSRSAFVRMHFTQGKDRYDELAEQMVRAYLLEGSYFPFYSTFPPEITRRYLLLGLYVIFWQDVPGSMFYIQFPEGTKESLKEVIPGLYTYPLRALRGEVCDYSIVDPEGREMSRESVLGEEAEELARGTRYEKLGLLKNGNTRAQYEYAGLCDMVDNLFLPIRE